MLSAPTPAAPTTRTRCCNNAPRRRRKLHILRSRLKPRAQSFRCSSSPNECDSHSLGTRSIFGDVHAAAENDSSPFRAHGARNSTRFFEKLRKSGSRLTSFFSPVRSAPPRSSRGRWRGDRRPSCPLCAASCWRCSRRGGSRNTPGGARRRPRLGVRAAPCRS